MSKKLDRHVQIRNLLLQHHEMKTKDLANLLQVTPETLRKDLDELQKQSLLVRVHGGVRLYNAPYEIPVEVRKLENRKEKQVISYHAFKHIQDGNVVYLDSSSTVILGLDNLIQKKDLTIVTNSLIIAQTCIQYDCDVIIAGGHIIKSGIRTYDYFATQVIDSVQIDIAIVGSEGLMDANGLTTSASELGFKKHVLKQSKKVIAVCDSTKFNEKSPYQFCKFEEIDLLITTILSDENKKLIKDVKEVNEVIWK